MMVGFSGGSGSRSLWRLDLILDLMAPSVRDRSGTVRNKESTAYAVTDRSRPLKMRLR